MNKKTNILFILSILCFAGPVSGQEGQRIAQKGLLRAQSTLATGISLPRNTTSAFIHGDLEYFASDRVSVRSETYYFLSTFKGEQVFSHNHSNYAGIFYHPGSSKRFDYYVGVQPGINYSVLDTAYFQAAYAIPEKQRTAGSFSPMASLSTGFNYFATKFFHLHFHARYLTGQHISDFGRIPLDAIRISFGLGIHLQVVKESTEE